MLMVMEGLNGQPGLAAADFKLGALLKWPHQGASSVFAFAVRPLRGLRIGRACSSATRPELRGVCVLPAPLVSTMATAPQRAVSRHNNHRRQHNHSVTLRSRCMPLMLLVHAAVVGPVAVRAAVPPAERAALMDLFRATSGPGWFNNTGWGIGDPCAPGHGTDDDADVHGAWHGVDCDPALQHVEMLDLNDNNLSGTLPDSISGLTHLTGLYVYSNAIRGTLPTTITTMSRMLRIEVFTNQMSGTIPDDIGLRLPHMTGLLLQQNAFSGTIPSTVGALENVTEMVCVAASESWWAGWAVWLTH